MVKLGELSTIRTGRLDVNAENPKGKYPFFTCSKNHTYIDEYAFEGESILVAGNGDLNIKYYNGQFNAYQRTYVIQPKADLHGKFLYYFLDNYVHKLREQSIGGVIKYIKLGNLTEAEIPLPSLSIQKQIAARLDKAQEIIRYNQDILKKYDELAQSLFLDMFGDPVKNEKGWEKVKLGDVCKVSSSRRVFVDELVENGIPFYRGTEIGALGNSEEIKPTLFITEEHYKHLKQETGVPSIGDLLMPSICPDGRIFEVKDNNPFYFKDGRVLWIKIDKEKVNSVYLKKFLKQLFATNYSKIASGTTFAELKIFALNDLTILYPPITLQNEFAERVQAIEAQKELAQEALAKSEELFQSLLQQSFASTPLSDR